MLKQIGNCKTYLLLEDWLCARKKISSGLRDSRVIVKKSLVIGEQGEGPVVPSAEQLSERTHFNSRRAFLRGGEREGLG